MQLKQLVFVTLCLVLSVVSAPAPGAYVRVARPIPLLTTEITGAVPVHNDARILEPAAAY